MGTNRRRKMMARGAGLTGVEASRNNRTLKALAPTWAFPLDPAKQPIRVHRVSIIHDFAAKWQFDVSAGLKAGATNIPQLLASSDGVTWNAPMMVMADGVGGLNVTYDSHVSIGAGCFFRVAADAANLALAFGVLIVPQTGVIVGGAGVVNEGNTLAVVGEIKHHKSQPKRRRAA